MLYVIRFIFGCLFLCLVASCATMNTISKLTIRGQVVDRQTGQPKVDVIVALLIHTHECTICLGKFVDISRTLTNKAGEFEFNNVGIGEYALEAFKSDATRIKEGGYNHIGQIGENSELRFTVLY